MNGRQQHALLHPYDDPAVPIDPYRSIRRHRLGFLIVMVLAVDR